MKSLTSIDEILHNQSEIRETAQAFFDENSKFPLHIEGLHGSLFSYFAAEVCRSNHIKAVHSAQYSATSKSSPAYNVFSSDLIIVVPTEADARDIAEDFSAIFEEAEVYIFPDWGTVPYRPVARGSLTFGKRAGVLSMLLNKTQAVRFNSGPRTGARKLFCHVFAGVSARSGASAPEKSGISLPSPCTRASPRPSSSSSPW